MINADYFKKSGRINQLVTMNAKPRHFLTLKEYSRSEIRDILDLAKKMKETPEKFSNSLFRKDLALIFQKTSTRTRVSFEAAMHQLGGNAIYLDWRTTNFTLGTIGDEIKSLERYVNGIMARVYAHSDIAIMADAASIPVINGLSDLAHPCQALADILTMEEKIPNIEDATIVFIGDGSNNVAYSLIVGCAILGYNIRVVCPEKFAPSTTLIEWVSRIGKKTQFEITSKIKKGVKDADVIYTDTFVSMGQESEKKQRLEILKPYQVNDKLVKVTGKEPFIMHCLPAHRDIEITSGILDSSRSIVFDQAENRMHAQKALLSYLL